MTNFARVIAFAGGILACISTASANGIIHVNNTCDFKADVRAFEEGDVVNAVPRSSIMGLKPGVWHSLTDLKSNTKYKISVTKKKHITPEAWHHNLMTGSSLNLC